MAGAGGEPVGGVVGGDAAAEVESAGVGGEGGAGGVVVAGAELDDVSAGEIVGAVAGGEGGGGLVGDEVFAQAGAVVAEGAADDLFYFAVVEIDAGPEARHGARSGTSRGRGSKEMKWPQKGAEGAKIGD